MASAVRQHQTYGNVAYDNAAPRRRDRGPQLHELPLVRPRKKAQEQVHTRVKVALRPREEYSILPAVGFLAAAFMAVMILFSYSQLDAIYAQTVQARSELSVLQAEEKTLTAQYEEIFDQAALEAAVASAGGDLTEARNDQKIYVDLSEPDDKEVYREDGNGLLARLKELLAVFQS